MEGSRRLDAVARDLASGRISRRTALRRFVGGAAGLAVPSALLADPALAKCPPSRKCRSKCCPAGQHCKHGKCKCKGGLTKCGKKCRDVSSDPSNCGSCGHACSPGQTCAGGQCTGGGTTGQVCGDGKADGSEICDGADLKGATCQSLGFTGGVLKCSANCTYDMSGCTSPSCTTAADCPQGPAGDCQKAVCESGTCGFVADNSDVPASASSCTQGICANGSPSQSSIAAGAACAGGVCNGQGACVGCNSAADCPQGPAADCKKAVCVSGTCGFANDDTDVQNDGNPCTVDSCNNGTVVHTPLAAGTACGNNMVCDNAGQCVGCNSAADCPQGAAGDCKQPVCDSGTCGFANDDNDIPADDGNLCTQDICVDGNPSHPPQPNGTVCVAQTCSNGVRTNASTCNGSGTCVSNGTTNCAPYRCNGTTCGTMCNTTNDCATGFFCSANSCVALKANGQACTGAEQCQTAFCVDGFCCNVSCTGTCRSCNVTGSTGTCTNVPAGTDPDDECAGASVCNGAGACT